jgi:hypothetical protein
MTLWLIRRGRLSWVIGGILRFMGQAWKMFLRTFGKHGALMCTRSRGKASPSEVADSEDKLQAAEMERILPQC